VRFQVLMVVGVKITDFWDVAPCILVEVYGCFRGACCLHHQNAQMMGAANTSKTSAPQKTVIFRSSVLKQQFRGINRV
jgi:hypothetical protein